MVQRGVDARGKLVKLAAAVLLLLVLAVVLGSKLHGVASQMGVGEHRILGKLGLDGDGGRVLALGKRSLLLLAMEGAALPGAGLNGVHFNY